MKAAAWFITIACIVQILGYAYALPGHLGDPTWSAHAQFHLLLSWIWVVGLDICLVALAWVPFRQQERWSLWLLLLGLLVAQGGHFITSLLVPAGRPTEWWYDYALALGVVIYAGGLLLGWRQMRAKA